MIFVVSSVSGAIVDFGPDAFPLIFCDVESLGSSLVYSMNAGAPGIYFRRTSGTFRPWFRSAWLGMPMIGQLLVNVRFLSGNSQAHSTGPAQ